MFSCRVHCKTVTQTELYPWVKNFKMKMKNETILETDLTGCHWVSI